MKKFLIAAMLIIASAANTLLIAATTDTAKAVVGTVKKAVPQTQEKPWIVLWVLGIVMLALLIFIIVMILPSKKRKLDESKNEKHLSDYLNHLSVFIFYI